MSDTDLNAVRPLPAFLVVVFLLGSVAALAGGYWDDAWHTERGRDSFFIAPHIAIYAGVGSAGGALAVWLAREARRRRLRGVLGHPPAVLAAVSVAATLASAPIDNTWHEAFGRDAVIWSPPHTLGIVGMGALAVAILVEVSRHPSVWARRVEPVAGALVLAAFAFLVVEYDTDVPQFDALWYLPALAGAASFALALVLAASRTPRAATSAAALHLAFIAGVALLLTATGFDAPKLPLVVAGAVVLDAPRLRARAPAVRAAAFTVALYVAYVPTLELAGDTIRLGVADVVLGLPIAWAASLLGLLAVSARRVRPRRVHAATAVTLLALAMPTVAAAHDPGQGPPAGTMSLTVDARSERVGVQARLPSPCTRWEAGMLIARRAGIERRASLSGRGCRYHGSVTVDAPGRWFVYANVRRGAQTVESWLPVKVSDGDVAVRDAQRYAYLAKSRPSSAPKVFAAVLLYGAMLTLLGALVVLVRRASRPPAGIS